MTVARVVGHAVACIAMVAATSGCAVLARALVVAEAVSTAQEIADGLPDEQPSRVSATQPHATVRGTGGEGLRLNGRPGGDRLSVQPDGTVVTVLCRTTGPAVGETSSWSFVRLADGATGYMSDAYLSVVGPPTPQC